MKSFKAILLGAAALACTVPATSQAAVVELGLAIDGSGSISSANFALQKNAYIAVLSDLSVLPRDGTVAIGIKQFSSSTVNVFTTAEITNGNFAALITALTNMSQLGGGTNIGSAINAFSTEIIGNLVTSNRQIIDVSTDGFGTVGTSREDAIANGIDQINCLGIGSGADCSVVQFGPGSFSIIANDFGDFEDALRRKIIRETTGGVPEPETWAMMIAGFGAVGAAMRRRRYNLKVSFV